MLNIFAKKPEPKSGVPEGKLKPLLTKISKELTKAGFVTGPVHSFAVGNNGETSEQTYPGCIGILKKKPLTMLGKLWVQGGPENEKPAKPDANWCFYTRFVTDIDMLEKVINALHKVRKNVMVEVVEA